MGKSRSGKRKAKEVEEPELSDSSDMAEMDSQPIALVVNEPKKTKRNDADSDASFLGKPIPQSEAAERWPKRYLSKVKAKKGELSGEKKESGTEEEVTQAKFHYTQALVDGVVYDLNDDAYVKAEDDKPDYIARIIEFFEAVDGELYFTAQWFYRAEDTAIKDLRDHSHILDKRRVFMSEIKDDNPLDCIVSKVKIAKVSPNMDLVAKEKNLPPCDLYYDMKYTVANLTFSTIDPVSKPDSDTSSTISSESGSNNLGDDERNQTSKKSEMTLLDLYSGCGAMSTGLCMGASLTGVKLVTRWAVDFNADACQSLKLNHPETEVRNEAAEDFLSLLKDWEKLCMDFKLLGPHQSQDQDACLESVEVELDKNEDNTSDSEDTSLSSEEFEVQELLAICHGDPNKLGSKGLYFKVRWKGYGSDEDTWEPIDGLSTCQDKLKEFVTKGYKRNMLPLPGDVDFICGGPPCQGVSGFNRFRDKTAPLKDIKNSQLLVYMSIIEYLKPKYVLMENVVDILKFSEAFLGRYALGRLVTMNYQARLGMMAAGSYGLPQFRMRVFLWGAQPSEKLPQYPLPTHEVVERGVVPTEFEEVLVGFNKNEQRHLEKALYLEDAISDLPPVENDESRDERPYETLPRTEFQKYIRLKRSDVVGYENSSPQSPQKAMLYDHRPLQLNQDDYERVCQIPKKKGANFRDLPGLLVGPDNVVSRDPAVESVQVSSGKLLVPEYALNYVRGKSTKPFGRTWWDETIGTVVTRAEPHNQIIIHPEQDRVLSVRELARLQGFPDFYKLSGPIKQRYMQVGNAVAVPVGIALGYTLGLASQGLSDDQPLTTLPFRFPKCISSSERLER
ncbi:putative DNA (cytosine-5)-methyltransferase CMT1 [Cannabis sativa]|uniref:DNA (cytosine-5-)-methyltransferase n=1 Tax=Cannabis sativa TaxID=3483 RepID=A0A803QNI9_CANSA|nr:putative DNA (cytosine-5)-methyltransferase CMT1 [Cannabis sativa]